MGNQNWMQLLSSSHWQSDVVSAADEGGTVRTRGSQNSGYAHQTVPLAIFAAGALISRGPLRPHHEIL